MTADGCMSMCQALSHPVLLQKTTEFKCWYQTLLSAALCVQSAEEHTAMYFRPYFSEPTVEQYLDAPEAPGHRTRTAEMCFSQVCFI